MTLGDSTDILPQADQPQPSDDLDEEKILEEVDRKFTQEIADRDRQYRLTLTCRSFERTDLGNAKRLIHRYGGDLLYSFPSRQWYIWDGTRYRPDDTGRILSLAKDTASRIVDEAQGLDDESYKKISSHAFATHQRRGIESMIALARSDIAVRPDDLDASPHLLNFKNCTLNLRTLQPQDHRREDRITRSCGCDYLSDASCTVWEKFIHRIMGGKEHLIQFLQRALGYALLGDPAERVIFLLYGPGGNGKSTLIGICSDILGDYAVQTPSETFLTSKNDRVRNDLARMNGARFVSAIETTKGRRLDESTVKLLTGYQDKIPARYLRQEFFEYRPKFVLFWSFNSKPAIRDTSQAMWDRVLLVPFIVVIPPEERDHTLPAKLKAELPGILNWMIDGLIQYREIGLAVPDEVKVATEEYHREEDYVSDFLLTCCEERPDAAEYFADLFIACCEFCNDTGRDPPTRKGFAKELKARFIHGKDKGGHYYQGLKIASRKEIISGNVTDKTGIQQNISGVMIPEGNIGNRDIGNVTDADQYNPFCNSLSRARVERVWKNDIGSVNRSPDQEHQAGESDPTAFLIAAGLSSLPDITHYHRMTPDERRVMGHCIVAGCNNPKMYADVRGMQFLCEPHYLMIKQKFFPNPAGEKSDA